MNPSELSVIQTHQSKLCDALEPTVELLLSKVQWESIITYTERQVIQNMQLDADKVLKVLDALAHRSDGFAVIIRYLKELKMPDLAEDIEVPLLTDGENDRQNKLKNSQKI